MLYTDDNFDSINTNNNKFVINDGPQTNLLPFALSSWVVCNCNKVKSAREQVQDEILSKMAVAIQKEDLVLAKKLMALAVSLKEL